MDNCLSRLIVDYLKENIMAIFERKGADVVEMNLKALRAGREFAQNYIK